MVKRVIVKPNDKISIEEMKKYAAEIEEAKASSISFDEDCRELSPAMLKVFKCMVDNVTEVNREILYIKGEGEALKFLLKQQGEVKDFL